MKPSNKVGNIPPPGPHPQVTQVPRRSILTSRQHNVIKNADKKELHATDTKFILPPKKLDTNQSFQQTSREEMNLQRMPPTKTFSGANVSSAAGTNPGAADDKNVSTIKSFLNAFGFQRNTNKTPTRYYEDVTYEVHDISLPIGIQILALLAPIWEWCMFGMGLASFFIITLLFAFSFYIQELYDIVYAIDVIFGIDTIIRACLEVWRFSSKIPCIIFITPYTMLQFIADIFSIIPLERAFLLRIGIGVLQQQIDVENLKWFDGFRFNRFIRMKRLFSFLNAALREQRIGERSHFFVKYFTVILMFIQVVASIFYAGLLPLDPIDFILKRRLKSLEGTWIGSLNDAKPGYGDNFLYHYVLSLAFSTAVVTTVGYGDVSPTSIYDMIFGIFAMLIGAIFLTGLFSSGLTSFELEHDGSRFDLFFRVDALMKHLIDIKTTPYYRARVLEYYNLLWNYREGVYNVQLFEQLPKTMQEEIWYDICQEMFHKSAIFRGLEKSFLRPLSRIAKPILYNPNMIICSKGKYAMQMIYIIQGELLVRSKYDSEKIAAILRPGCIIGEINLFFSYPYTTNVETRTCCQLLVFEKEALFDLLSLYPSTLEHLRNRVQERLSYIDKYYKVVGEVPLYWIEHIMTREDEVDERDVFPVSLRKGTGWNPSVTHDILDDSKDMMIVEMPCINSRFEKVHTTVYKSAVIPNILISENKWIRVWQIIITFIGLYGAFLGPYCLVFKATSQFESAVCNLDANIFEWFVSIICLLDVFVEVINAVPVSGYYYKFRDGFYLKVFELGFWLDVASALPLNLIGNIGLKDSTSEYVKALSIAGTAMRCVKLWKVLRYFNYLDNTHYSRLFTLRVLQTLLVLLYFTHFLACIMFMIACPSSSRFETPKCKEDSWLRSYQVRDSDNEAVQFDKLSQDMPYLLSFYFSLATLTSAGFGDFNPQNLDEIIFIVLFQLISFTIIGYYTAILTSALSCTIRPQLVFQQKLLGIRQFMEHQGVSEDLQHRVVEHYHLQNFLWAGVTLPDKIYHFMFDTPDYLREDSLILETELSFEGVPLLTKVDPKIIVKIAELVRRYLIPPNTIFLRKGEVRRQMYIIGKGSVGILNEKQEPERILGPTSHFGIRDLLFGEPAHNHIKTLSYCVLYEIEYHDLDELFDKEPFMVKLIDQERSAYQKDVDAMTRIYAQFKTTVKEKPKTVESWAVFPSSQTKDLKGYSCTFDEYNEVFKPLRFKWLYSILLHKTVHPAGLFSKIWLSVMSFVSCVTLVFLLLETYGGKRDTSFRILQYCVDFVNYIDIYIKLHWGFYTKKNILISHPGRTALHYIYEGGFLYDLMFTAPFEFIVPILSKSHLLGYSNSAFWFSKMRWTRLGQVLRIPAIVSVCNKIFTMRNETLVLLYIWLTIVLCTSTSCIALYIACPIGSKLWEEGDENKLPFCLKDSWAALKDQTLIEIVRRLIFGIYYTSNVFFAIGFGDLITLRRSELVLLIIMMVVGFMVDVTILANITAAEVDIDENRAKFLEAMQSLEYILYREKINKRLRKQVREHLQHTWIMSKGLQPKTLFVDLHPALESDLFREYVGELLAKVPVFSGLPENIVRTLCQYMKKYYFLKGEAMMRAGNLENVMYIIVSGKVWITDKDNEWICTLRSKETFGETSMLYGTQRRYSAYAGSVVEAFALTSADYNEVLERYPIAEKHLRKKVKSSKIDLFEYKVRRDAGPIQETVSNLTTTTLKKNEARSKKINSYIKTKLLVDPGEHDARSYVGDGFLKHVIGTGTDDENLPFIYFAKRFTNDKSKIPLFHPECLSMKIFSNIVVILCFLTPMLGTYEMIFVLVNTQNQKLTVLHTSPYANAFYFESEAFLLWHIFIQFFKPFRIEETLQFCKEWKKIAFNYACSPSRFPCDIVAFIPTLLLLIYYPTSDDQRQKLTDLRWFWIVRLFRLVHFYKAVVQKKDDLGSGIFFYKITVSLSTFILIIHGVCCAVLEFSKCYCADENCINTDKTCPPGTWTHKMRDAGDFGPEEMTPVKWYVRSFYWVTSTVSTTGFGDIVPFTVPEILIATLCTFVGAFVLAIILSQFTSGISSLTKAHREYLYQVNLLSKHLGNIGTSHSRRDQVRNYFVKLWEASRGTPYHEAIVILPISMQIEVNFFLYYNAIKNSTLFYRINDKTFLRQVCHRLKHTLLLPGSVIVNEGDQGDSLFIVFKGVVTGFTEKGEGPPKVTRQYHRGNVFGKYPALFYDQPYRQSYRTETTTEVLSLSQEDLIILKDYFPDFAESLQFAVIRKYTPEPNIESIFQKRMKRRGLFSLESGLNLTSDTGPGNVFEESKRIIEQALKEKEKEKELSLLNSYQSPSSSSSESSYDDHDFRRRRRRRKGGRSKKKKVGVSKYKTVAPPPPGSHATYQKSTKAKSKTKSEKEQPIAGTSRAAYASNKQKITKTSHRK